MLRGAYYNEIDPFCCDVLRARIADGGLPDGEVDERSIVDVQPDDVRGFAQCHFFAGIGGFGLAQRLAGWPDDLQLWTGGFPCQDISTAGKGAGLAGERSGLWWEFFRLIDACRPARLIPENVPALRTRGADDVLAALEGIGYACWPLVVGAWAVRAPHQRDRVWIVAHADVPRAPRLDLLGREATLGQDDGANVAGCGGPGSNRRVAHARSLRREGDGCWGDSGTSAQHGEGSASARGDCQAWPARPGEPQHEWEAPRLVEFNVGGAIARLPQRLDPSGELVDGSTRQAGPCEILRLMQQADVSEANRGQAGGYVGVPASPLLRRALHGEGEGNRQAHIGNSPLSNPQVGADGEGLQDVRVQASPAATPRQSGQVGQPAEEHSYALRQLSREASLAGGPKALDRRLRSWNKASLKAMGNAIVPQVAVALMRSILTSEGINQ